MGKPACHPTDSNQGLRQVVRMSEKSQHGHGDCSSSLRCAVCDLFAQDFLRRHLTNEQSCRFTALNERCNRRRPIIASTKRYGNPRSPASRSLAQFWRFYAVITGSCSFPKHGSTNDSKSTDVANASIVIAVTLKSEQSALCRTQP